MSGLLDGTRAYFDKRAERTRSTFDERGRLRMSKRANIARSAKWQGAARQRLAALRSVRYDTDALISVPDDLTRITFEMMSAAAPAVSESYQQHLVPVGRAADDAWPVDTGLSRALLALVFQPESSTRFVGKFTQQAPYGWFIRFARRRRKGKAASPAKDKGRHVWTALIRRPTEKAVDKMVDTIGAELVR